MRKSARPPKSDSLDFKKILTSMLLGLLLFGLTAGTADAFNFRGHTYNETNATLGSTNVSMEVYEMGSQGPQLLNTFYNTSDATTGNFNVSVTGPYDNSSYFYKPVLKHFNGTTLDYIGQSLPHLPYFEISRLAMGPPVNFYLRRGGTININATNGSANQPFRYMIKDTRLGYPVSENFNVEVENVNNIHVPLERNYSIMIYPNRSFPVSYDLNNLTTYPNKIANITFNTSNTLRRVSGYAKVGDSANFTDLKIIAYLMEPGNMIFQDYPLPYNMSAWNCPAGPGSCESDIYNLTSGEYNITLPGAAMNANILLFAAARNSSDYYGAFRNISLNYSNAPETGFNFTLQPLLGTQTIITLNNASGGMGPPGITNVTTKKLSFQLKNGSSSGNNITGFAHVEVEVNYSAYNGSSFSWMVDVSQSANGSFSIPALNASIRKINVFTQDFAPLKTSKNTSQLQVQPVNINLTRFKPERPDGVELSGISMNMLLSKPECDVPNPASGCSLMPDPSGQNMSEFNPFKIVMGGGKISLRISKPSLGITVHYKNVDMLASGPPDALFDESASQSQSGSAIEQAWRFGSKGPEIYDEVLIGVPYTSGLSISGVRLGKLYDDNWGTAWDISTNTTAQLPSEYSTFNSTWFNSTGMPCSTSDITAACYIDVTNGTLWLRIPHFSGIGPTVLGTTTTTTTSGDSGGGGGGGGGGPSGENFTNIIVKEQYDLHIFKDIFTSYRFTDNRNPVLFINITGNVNAGLINTAVEVLKDTSTPIKTGTPAPGIVYKNINIWVGTSGFALPKNIKEAAIRFKVENSWIGSNNLASSDVKMLKWDGSKWVQLETSEKTKDNTYTYYEAKTDSFSPFAISGLKGVAVPTATPAITIIETPPIGTATPTPVPTKKGIPGFEAALAIAAILAVYVLGRKRR